MVRQAQLLAAGQLLVHPHLLERELSQIDESASEEEIKKRLQGLGYLS